MQKKQFSFADALKNAWHLFKGHAFFLIGVLVTVWLITLVLSYVQALYIEEALIYTVLYIISLLVQTILAIGLTKISLNILNKKEVSFKDLFSHTKYFWRYLGCSIVYGIIVMVGFILLIVPGIIWAIKYGFSFYLIIDKDMGVMDSLKRSGEIANGAKWPLFLFGIILVIINVLGAFALLVGLLITIPVTMLAQVHVYKLLEKMSGKAAVKKA